DVTLTAEAGYVAPRNDTEAALVDIWSEVLGFKNDVIGVHDSFFDLGGHSLLATQVVSKIRKQFNLEVSLNTLFENPRIDQFVHHLITADTTKIKPIEVVDRTEVDQLPLSFAQERLWFLHQLDPGDTSYNVPGAFYLRDQTSLDHIELALNILVERHESLRTIFVNEQGKASQQIIPDWRLNLEVVNLTRYRNHNNQQKKLQELCLAEATTPFDLAKGPLMRGLLFQLDDQNSVILLNFHHTIMDGWSVGVLFKELAQVLGFLNKQQKVQLPALEFQYADFAVWQRSWLENSDLLQSQLKYWQTQLAGAPASLELLTDFPRKEALNVTGGVHRFELDQSLVSRLNSFAEQHGCTLFMQLLSVFKVLLWRYTGQSDICIGTPIANRHYEGTQALVGMFVNTLVIRTQFNETDDYVHTLNSVRQTCMEAYENQDAPFEKVVDAVQPERIQDQNPLFQVMFILQNTESADLVSSHEPYPLDIHNSLFDISMEFEPHFEGHLSGFLKYNDGLFKAETIARMAAHFEALCEAVLLAADSKIAYLDYLTDAEKQQLSTFNDTAMALPENTCLHDLFINQVKQDPNAIAVVLNDAQLTYQQLHDKSQQFACYLQQKGVLADELVGLYIDRSEMMLVGIIGIMMAGGAYVPLDPGYPDQRLNYMLNDSGVKVIVTEASLSSKIQDLADNEVLCIDIGDWQTIESATTDWNSPDTEPRKPVKPENLAYVIYTSGSTGQPKGVMIQHRSVINHTLYVSKQYGLDASDVQIQFASMGFDLFIEEVFVVLSVGARLVLADKDELLSMHGLAAVVKQFGVTAFNLPTAFFHQLVSAGFDLSPIKTIIVGGEKLDKQKSKECLTKYPELNLYNTYGPTETTIISSMVRANDVLDYPELPIGKPIANTALHVLDQWGNQVPVGVPGELHIAGEGLARGYLHRPDLTAEKFIDNPYQTGSRMYCSGDLVRWLADGNLEYLGRIDTQVKIRGFRIETGEIESTLFKHEQIADCVVVAQGDQSNKTLVAFYTADSEAELASIEPEKLRGYLQTTLPEYMVPSVFVGLDSIPLTPNGKVDRKALENHEVERTADAGYVAPRNETEAVMVDIWASVLGLKPEVIGVYDSFFNLGGHSLLATQVISKIRNQINLEVSLRTLFDNPQVAQFVHHLSSASVTEIKSIEVIDREKVNQLPLSFAQERLWFLDQLYPGDTTYNLPGAFYLKDQAAVKHIEQALNILIERHESLRTVFVNDAGQASQEVLPDWRMNLELVDLTRHRNKRKRELKLREMCEAEAATPFDLATGPLMRGILFKLDGKQSVILLNFHHTIMDGWSVGVLFKELSLVLDALKNGQAVQLPPLDFQYVDFAAWQRHWLEDSDLLQAQLAYWQNKLSGVPASLELLTDYPRKDSLNVSGAVHRFELPASLVTRMNDYAEQHGCTLFMHLLTVFKVLLWRYTGQQDICIGSPIANRQYEGTQALVGMFVNTLVFRSQFNKEDDFVDTLIAVKHTCLEAYENQDAPFEKVVDAVQPERIQDQNPLFQIMFILQNTESADLVSTFESYPLDVHNSLFDISMEFEPHHKGHLEGFLKYNNGLFKPETIAKMAHHYVALCEAVLVAADTNIGAIDFLDQSEKDQLLIAFNDTGVELAADRCLHQLFESQAQSTPDAPALLHEGKVISYGELELASRQLALYLQARGIGAGDLVAVCLDRSPIMVTAL
ncbi:non-ribosomal peptide synthetase, partial [Marinicella sediminis]